MISLLQQHAEPQEIFTHICCFVTEKNIKDVDGRTSRVKCERGVQSMPSVDAPLSSKTHKFTSLQALLFGSLWGPIKVIGGVAN